MVGVDAALGAPLRYLIGLRWDTERFPWGIWSANVLGSWCLGLFVGADVTDAAMALIGTGFCGGFTTYSAFALGTVERGPRQGALYAMLTIGVAVPACVLGFAAGNALL